MGARPPVAAPDPARVKASGSVSGVSCRTREDDAAMERCAGRPIRPPARRARVSSLRPDSVTAAPRCCAVSFTRSRARPSVLVAGELPAFRGHTTMSPHDARAEAPPWCGHSSRGEDLVASRNRARLSFTFTSRSAGPERGRSATGLIGRMPIEQSTSEDLTVVPRAPGPGLGSSPGRVRPPRAVARMVSSSALDRPLSGAGSGVVRPSRSTVALVRSPADARHLGQEGAAPPYLRGCAT